MNKEEMLLDTLKYYSADTQGRRCKGIDYNSITDPPSEKSICYYDPVKAHKPTSEGCAIGRHMSDEQKTDADEYNGVDSLPSELIPNSLKHLQIEFLSDVQYLHDVDRFWTVKGLSTDGVRQLLSIITLHDIEKGNFKEYLNERID